jgi:hypothetical protein
MKQIHTYSIILFILLIAACKKETFITSKDALLSLTADTLHFDTVFTSIGSVTQVFKIRNDNNQKLRLSNITLMGGAGSPFKINADGITGPDIKNIEIEANDSIYVFVSVSINPNLNNLPFIIRDSIEIGYNSNKQYLQLEAWGQNANFLRNKKITGNVTWTNNLPYVILGSLQVDTSATLIINKGCKIYLHADAAFLVDGTLKVNGEKFDSTRVYFKSDRLDNPYSEYPGSWPGIYFRGQSKDNIIQYAIIQNGYQGIVAELPSVNANPKVILNECIIDNMYDAGILGIQSSVTARNCLVSNCGATKEGNGNITLAYGGNYNFIHCTAAGISNNYIPHLHPVLAVYDYINQNNVYYTADLTASFTNCIFWGDSLQDGNEVIVDKKGTGIFNVQFANCLWREKSPPPSSIATANFIINIQGAGQDTVIFNTVDREKRIFNFRLKDNSPALNTGTNTGVVFDLDGNPRAIGLPDLGCYEKQ